MVRVVEQKEIVAGDRGFCYTFAGRSDDTKPVTDDIVTGSFFYEVDTGDVYAYDEEASAGSEWSKFASLGGGA